MRLEELVIVAILDLPPMSIQQILMLHLYTSTWVLMRSKQNWQRTLPRGVYILLEENRQ